jgi:hypothetical protein
MMHLKEDGSSMYACLQQCHADLMAVNMGIKPSTSFPASFTKLLSTYSSDKAAPVKLQHSLCSQMYRKKYNDLLKDRSLHVRAAVRSASSANATYAFTVLPTCKEFTIPTDYFNQIVRQRLMLPIHDSITIGSKCSIFQCNAQLKTEDERLHHHHSCPKLKRKEITARHDGVLNQIIHLSKEAGYTVMREPNVYDKHGNKSRPDASLLSSRANKPFKYVDVCVTDPCAKSHVQQASKAPLTAAKYRETYKTTKYGKVAQDDGATFAPLVLETYGGFGKQLCSFLSTLCEQASEFQLHSPRQQAEFAYHARASIAVALQIGNARIAIAAFKQTFMASKRRTVVAA